MKSLEALRAQVENQRTLIPSLYGDVDFSKTPERFTADTQVQSMLPVEFSRKYRKGILAEADRVERARLYTMLGDNVADAYAALAPTYRIRPLIDMLKKACDEGVENVEDAPQELIDFIRSMEHVPDWVDMGLVREGARYSRNMLANLSPFAIRGAFIATFMNKYSGLPMALTGTLSGQSAVQRVNETASFFTTAALPGALDRYGQGFKAAAMVRLMHSMVRFNILKRSKKWDVSVYGIPIPQVDQMPAGTIPAFIAAFNTVRKGRTEFGRRDRAVVELCRYQSYLLGLPEDLLPEKPQEIFDVMLTYAGTLRDGYDDETCGELVRATMSAYRPRDKSLRSRIFNTAEKGFSKVFFTRTFLRGNDKSMAKRMGVQPGMLDYGMFIASNLYILPRLNAHMLLRRVPVVSEIADLFLIRKLNRLLVEYGHAEYVTDAAKYKDRSVHAGGDTQAAAAQTAVPTAAEKSA